jgi:hypothetical protein
LDIKDLVSLEEVMEDLELGPNGGLVYCFECVTFLSLLLSAFADAMHTHRYLMENLDWLSDALGDFEDDYVRFSFPPFPSFSLLTLSSSQLIIDCPGQIELYTHIPILPRLAKLLTGTMNINVVACYLLESQFMEDTPKYFSGVLSAMSCMIGLEVPFVNVMSKMDLVRKEGKRKREVDRLVERSSSCSACCFFSMSGTELC